MNLQKNDAIDLMIEDLYTSHPTIRNLAKERGCEDELNNIRDEILKYINAMRDVE